MAREPLRPGIVTVRVLLTTFECVLALELAADFALGAPRLVHAGSGIYFGITRPRPGLAYVVARNLDSDLVVQGPAETNAILEIDLEDGLAVRDRWSHPAFCDLHQIRAFGHHLAVLTTPEPHLLFVDPARREVVRAFALAPHVPEDLRHSAPEGRGRDTYHFNSLSFRGRRLFVLAHNWRAGSFALEFRLPGDGLPERLEPVATHRGLGLCSHDVVEADGVLHVLDGLGGRLLLRGACEAVLDLPGAADQRRYPRGLAVTDRHLLIASGIWSPDRAGRVDSALRLTVVERRSLRIVADHALGRLGNSCDVTVLDGVDWSDAAS